MITYHIKNPDRYKNLNQWASTKRKAASYVHHLDYDEVTKKVDVFFFDTVRGVWFYVTVPVEKLPQPDKESVGVTV